MKWEISIFSRAQIFRSVCWGRFRLRAAAARVEAAFKAARISAGEVGGFRTDLDLEVIVVEGESEKEKSGSKDNSEAEVKAAHTSTIFANSQHMHATVPTAANASAQVIPLLRIAWQATSFQGKLARLIHSAPNHLGHMCEKLHLASSCQGEFRTMHPRRDELLHCR